MPCPHALPVPPLGFRFYNLEVIASRISAKPAHKRAFLSFTHIQNGSSFCKEAGPFCFVRSLGDFMMQAQNTLLRFSQLNIKRTSLYRMIAQGLWTKPVKLGPRASGWPLHEVEALNAARISGKSPDDIRGLVQNLEAERKTA